ncbi:MAG: TonB-dependent receptor [Pseudoxanthomonas sp.]
MKRRNLKQFMATDAPDGSGPIAFGSVTERQTCFGSLAFGVAWAGGSDGFIQGARREPISSSGVHPSGGPCGGKAKGKEEGHAHAHFRLRQKATWPLLAAAALCPAVAIAQDDGGNKAQDEAKILDAVVVTSQKRVQNVQDVPISIQAFSLEALEDAGVNKVEDLALVTPGLTMTKQLLSNTPYIRGIGSPDSSPGAESPVSMYIDGVYVANPYGTVYSLSSIDRIEVLKGPQGTLFGRNATGGLVNVITRDPQQDRWIEGSFSFGNYETFGAKLYATTGIAENVAADIAISFSNQGKGFGRNLTNNSEINSREDSVIRTKWLITPSENTEIRFTADSSELKSSLGVIQAVYPGSLAADGALVFAGCVAGLGGDPSAPTAEEFAICQPIGAAGATRSPDGFYDSYQAAPGVFESETKGVSLRVDHRFGDLEFASISAYRESNVTGSFEQLTSRFPAVLIDVNQGYETFTQELQLQKQGERFGWIVGAFYLDDKSGFFPPDGLYVRGIFLGDVEQNITSPISTRSYAVFGETNFALTERTRLTTGLRWTRDERQIDNHVFVNGDLVAEISDSKSWSEPTWRVVLDHHLSDRTMVYGSYSRGFKSGNFPSASPGSPPVNPELIDAYEVGFKSTILDGGARLNGAMFFYDYSDMQVTRTSQGALVTENAAAAEVLGLEVDFVANLTANLSTRVGFSYLDTEYTEFKDAPVSTPNPSGLGGNVISALDVSGHPLARAPDYTFNVGFNYDVSLGIGEVSTGVNYAYNDGYSWEPAARIRQDAYGLLSAYAAWRSASGEWGLRLYGNNLTNEKYYSFVTEQEVVDAYAPAPPRTFGLEVSFEF